MKGLAGRLRNSVFAARGREGSDDVDVFERGGVAFERFAGGDLLEEAAHDLAGTRFRQRSGKADLIRRGDRTDDLADVLLEFVFESTVGLDAFLHGDEADDALAFQFIWTTDDGGLGDGRMRNEGAFDFGGAETMTGDVEHVVDAANDPDVAVFVTTCSVASEIPAFEVAPVSLLVAFLVAPNATQHGRPGLFDDELALLVRADLVAEVIDDADIDAKEGQRGGAGLGGDGTGDRRDHVAAGFSLPPGIDDGALAAADELVIPHPGFWIDRLSDGA